MPSPFNATGQQDLRQYITNNWTQLALVDDSDTIEAVLDIPSDSRVSWSDPVDNPIEARATVNGNNADITAGVGIGGTALFPSGESVSAGDALADVSPVHDDAFDNVNTLLIAAGQETTLIHEIQQPQL